MAEEIVSCRHCGGSVVLIQEVETKWIRGLTTRRTRTVNIYDKEIERFMAETFLNDVV
jgi:hypothetical protein